MSTVICTQCHRPYPEKGLPYRCPYCKGIFDYTAPPAFDPRQIDIKLPGMWRYRHAFDLPADAPVVWLGEGMTPLVWDEAFGQKIAYKLEYLSPTGSYKDRSSAVTVSYLLSRGVHEVVEDSSGNAGASLAAYAARTGIKARIFVPGYASGPKRKQIEAFGARLIEVNGPRSAASQAVRNEAERGAVYASHAFLPFGMVGVAAIAYELYEQIGNSPGTIIAPVGHGSLLLGILRGFKALLSSGLIKALPAFVGVQASACAPIFALFTGGEKAERDVQEGETLAEGVRIRKPLRAAALLNEMQLGRDHIIAVDENEILPARADMAQRGFYVEPTSAIVWAALRRLAGRLPEPIILILSGSGYKFN